MRIQSRCIQLVSLLVLLGMAACSSDSASLTAPSSTPAEPPSTPPQVQRVTVPNTCYSPLYQGYSQSDFGCGVRNSFGDPSFDAAFAAEIPLQDSFFGFTVAVAPFDECSSARANALSIKDGGFIVYGNYLARRVMAMAGFNAGVAGTLAHEYAHQVQFRNGWEWPSDGTVRPMELEADAFSGVYMGLVKGFDSAMVNSYFRNLQSFGSYDFNDPSHHGTPEERVRAGYMGLLVANDMIENGTRPTWAQLHSLFVSRIGPSSLNQRLDVGISDRARTRIEALFAGESPVVPARGASVASLNIRPK